MAVDELAMHARKNHDYARGGDRMGNFRRCASFFSMYPNLKLSDPRVFTISLMMKQLDAVLWAMNQGGEQAVESIDDKLRDIHIYTKIVRVINKL